jgi:tetratricopeptide (TPR) repeat protein
VGRPVVLGALMLIGCSALGLAQQGTEAPRGSPSQSYELRARKLIEQQQFAAALTLLDSARSLTPEVLFLRGYTLYRLHSLDEARAQLEEVTRTAPPALRSCYFLGRIALLQAKPEQAIRWLLAPANEDPPIEDAPAQLGKAYFDAHQLEAAQRWTDRAVRLTPWDGNLHYRLARLHQQLGQSEAATKEFQASLDSKIADREAVQSLLTGAQEIAHGNLEAAREIRDSLLKKTQLDPDILVALGSEFATAGVPNDAVSLFTEAARRDPSSFQAHFDLGLAFLKIGRTEDAVDPLQASLRIAPTSVDGNAALGLSYVLLGKYVEALPELELVHSAQPDNGKTAGLLALTYLRTGAARKAIPIVKARLAKQDDDPKLFFLLIDCFNADEKEANAVAVAEEAVQRFPSLAKAHLAKGQQLARLGRYREAGPSFAKAVELAPQELEPLLGLAEARNKAGDYEQSLASYQLALQLDPDQLTALLGSARDLVALKRIPEARDVLERAALHHGDDRQVHFELSRVYARLGEPDEAARETAIVQRLRNQNAVSDGVAQ